VSATKPAAPEPSEIAGRYLIEKKLGAGAFGTVFKAKDKDLGRMVAIKTIRLEGLAASTASLEDLLKRFKQEAQVAARLRHPNIVMLYDIGTWEGLSYISMEFVDGVGLDRVISGSGKMAVERAAAIGAQVADALAVAHKHGVVHRDIKPANIMIEPGDHVKVADFGIAKVTDSAEHLTVTGSLLGTPSYMSPEQARGGAIDGRSDLFSVGCILYEMLAGQRAFRGDSITALLFKIITEEPPSLRELDPTVSDEMLRIIAKALSKKPEDRYQSGRELADDLLAVTRPGFVPTLRAKDTPTLPPDAPPGDVPTISSAPTAQSPATLSSAGSAGAPPPLPPPVPPTILTPATARAEAPRIPPIPQKPAAAPARAARPLVSAPERRKGGGTGLIVGLGGAGLSLVALIVGGGWYMLRRNAATTSPDVATAATPAPAVSSTPADPGPGARAEAAPTPAAATPAPPAASPTHAQPSPRVASGAPPVASRGATIPTTPAGSVVSTPGTDEPAASDFSHLNDIPAEESDGRAAGDALAQKYRSGGGTSYSTSKYRARPQMPPNLTRAERPAVGTLLYLNTIEQAFYRKNNRYGTLRELQDAGLLAIDVAHDGSGFRRMRYGFRLTAESDGYRADALPQGPVGRAFVVDDTGKVRLPDE